MDTTTQIVLVLMIIVLGMTLTIVSIMLVFILRDLRETVGKVNVVLDDFQKISSRLASGSIRIEEVLNSLKSAVDIFKNQAASPIGSLFGLISFVRTIFKDEKGGDEENE